MNKTIAVLCSTLAVSALHAQVVDENVPNKPAKVLPPREHVQRVQKPVPHVQQQNHPAFYRRNTNYNPTVQQRLHNNGLNQTRVYTRGQVQHFNLNAAANPRIQSAKFVAGARINGAQKWQGHNYAAFRSYNSQWHDRAWWHHHHNRIVLIGGGYYYWDAGWWYPAWGYDTAYSYYPYDGPIYAYNDLPPDQVIANVQAALQSEGYYTGEVDGMLGPLTRSALAAYQADHGLYTTAAIDQPTLNSLGMG